MENQENENYEEVESVEVDSGEGVEFEIVDDTPEEDKNRKPLERDVEPEEDEIEKYSSNVQKRIKELSHARHDERRAKEAALREREQAIELAKKILDQNKELKDRLQFGENAYVEASKQKATIEYENAKRKLMEAKSIGDIEAEIEAQEEFNRAQMAKVQVESFKPPPLQIENPVVNIPQSVQNTETYQKVDPKAMEWRQRNPWFWVDKAMTGAALGTHEELVETGYDPQSDDYYRELDSRMRKMFPHKFSEEQSRQQNKRPSTVVASATRSSPSKKITLSSSEVALARRLNLPLEVYAKQKLELEKRNG